MKVNKWILTTPDNPELYNYDYCVDAMEYVAEKFEVVLEFTGNIRDQGFGQEEEILLDENIVDKFMKHLELVLYIANEGWAEGHKLPMKMDKTDRRLFFEIIIEIEKKSKDWKH